MRYFTILLLGLALQATAQIATDEMKGFDYVKLEKDGLRFYENSKEGYNVISYKHFKHRDEEGKKPFAGDVKGEQFIAIQDLDADFDLLKEMRGKVITINSEESSFSYEYKYVLYLKNDTSLLLQVLKKNPYEFEFLWRAVKPEEYIISIIKLGEKRRIYWNEKLGIIYKTNNQIGVLSNLLFLKKNTAIKMFKMSDFYLGSDYFDFGEFQILAKKDKLFTVLKQNKVIIDSLPVKMISTDKILAYDDKKLTLYDINMQVLESYHIRNASFITGSVLSFVVENSIKTLSIKKFEPFYPEQKRPGWCGIVSYHLLFADGGTLKYRVERSFIALQKLKLEDLMELNIPPTITFDSIFLANRNRVVFWSDNDAFDSRAVLVKDGKEGYFNLEVKNPDVLFKQILPMEFDDIKILDNYVIVTQNNLQELANYYQKNNQFRFKRLAKVNDSGYLRYEKSMAHKVG